jgi:uncharacterized protein (UPF0305 family)
MNSFNSLAKLPPPEMREFLKENSSDPSFIAEVVEQKEKFVPLLLKAKSIPDNILKELCKNGDRAFLLDLFIEYNYIPSLSFIEDYASEGLFADPSILKAIQAFPSLPISAHFLMKMINNELLETATYLIKLKKEFQKPDVLLLVMKSGSSDPDLISLFVTYPDLVSLVAKAVKDKSSRSKLLYSNELINAIIMSCSEDDLIINQLIEHIDQELFTVKSISKILRIRSTSRRFGVGYRSSIKWTPELENEDIETYRLCEVDDVPEGSKFRTAWIMREPYETTDDELIALINNGFRHGEQENYIKAARRLFQKPLSLIKKAELNDFFWGQLRPKDLIRSLFNEDAKIKYFYEIAPDRFKLAIKKNFSIIEKLFPTEPTSGNRKKSYFFEIFTAIKDENIAAFRENLNKGYSLEQFLKDTHQSSKSESCSETSVSKKIYLKLDKEEFLSFIDDSNFQRFPSDNYGSSPTPTLTYTLTPKEAVSVIEKTNEVFAYHNCSNKLAFLKIKEVSVEGIQRIFLKFKSEITEDSQLFSAYLSRCSVLDTEFSSEAVKGLAKKLTRPEIKKVVSKIEKYSFSEFIKIKCADGEYFLNESEILQKLNDRYAIENTANIDAIMKRNPELGKKIITAYLGGNKALSELMGCSVKITRTEKVKFQKLYNNLEKTPEVTINEIFEKGGNLQDFQNNLEDWKHPLLKYAAGRAVIINEIGLNQLAETVSELSQLKISVNTLILLGRYDSKTSLTKILSVCRDDRVVVNNLLIPDSFNYSIADLKKIISTFPNAIVSVAPEMSSAHLVELVSNSINFEGSSEKIKGIVETAGVHIRQFSNLNHLKFLEKQGMIFNEKLIKVILNWHFKDPEIITWLSSRVGGLEDYYIIEANSHYFSEDETNELISLKKAIEKSGLQEVTSEKIKFIKFTEQLLEAGKSFEPIDISSYSLKEKTDLITFIEQKIDSNYLKLDLISSNLAALEELRPYSFMIAVHSLDEDELAKQFNIASGIMSNKKIVKAFREFLSMDGGRFFQKVSAIKRVFAMLNPKIDLAFSDFINYTNQSALEESDSFKALNFATLAAIESNAMGIQNQSLILKNKDKTSISRFLRSASQKDESYLADVISMCKQVVNGISALYDRMEELKKEAEDNAETIGELQESIDNVRSRLIEVSGMDDIEHMHDRLVPLLSFIKTDPLQPLGQHKFSKLEESKEVSKHLGLKLYFPKTRGDLQLLGDTHGWCINYNRDYADNVILEGNILVGLCKLEDDVNIENVIALAYYLHEDDGSYSLEQLKWSERLKKERNVDATANFDHSSIKRVIVNHLIELQREKEREEAKKDD